MLRDLKRPLDYDDNPCAKDSEDSCEKCTTVPTQGRQCDAICVTVNRRCRKQTSDDISDAPVKFMIE
jgi:hypothetical protein